MRCRHCKQRFRLYETIYLSYPPGRPISPGGSLIVLLPIFAIALTSAAAVPTWRRPALFIAGVAALLYLGHYVFYWFLEKRPWDRKRPGVCPHCGTYNAPMPWSI